MYTNTKNHGGNFADVINKEMSSAKNIVIATGYASLDIIHQYEQSFVRVAEAGGVSRLLLGMAFYEGLGQKTLDKDIRSTRRLLWFLLGALGLPCLVGIVGIVLNVLFS